MQNLLKMQIAYRKWIGTAKPNDLNEKCLRSSEGILVMQNKGLLNTHLQKNRFVDGPEFHK
jgi:hypothetical protein